MGWVEHAIWWHVYPLGAVGAPVREPDAAPAPHRLDRLLPWLDHVVALGANGLLLGPVFASSTHGYDTTDHYRVDPRLGTDEDLDRLLAAARERGLRVVLDGVFHHVGAEHPLVAQALAEGRDGPRAGFLRVDWDHPDSPRTADFEGHRALVALNHDDPAVAAYVTDVMTHWLDRGVDGWRLDAAYAVPPAFWARVLPAVRERHPDAWVVGEVIHGDYAGVVAASGMDSVTQYELWKAVWSSLLDRNFWELDHALGRHAQFLEAFVPQTFVGNHDVTRIATQVGPEAAVLALVVLMTVGGVPSLYYGDELGWAGLKEEREGGDDAIRPALPSSPADVDAHARDVLAVHRELVALRRRHAWLHTARTVTDELSNTRYRYAATSADGAHRLHVELDVTDAPHATVRDADGTVLFAR
ncbi:MAG: alpha-amylase family protein [Cellulomonas iranensis]|uniref:alpha-amylase family protein n=1 Tax=Cellulomonas iranensis TaxID=76862 RepID=UPI001B2BB6A8|nr:alpha-amylase family protein [Cellulomonas iranensis]MBO9569356.1 alpha-amylase family protein [Cellulomonas iranensis]